MPACCASTNPIHPSELNASFADEVAAKVPRSKQLILLCESGGSLENKSGTKVCVSALLVQLVGR